MATIRPRKRSDGGTSWRVRIKLNLNGEPYTESRTFTDRIYKRRDAEAWAKNRERELLQGSRLTKAARHITLEDMTRQYIEEFEAISEWGKTKAADLRHLMNYDITRRPAVELKAQDFIEHIKARRRSVAASTANNDLIWWRVIYQIAIGAWDMPLSLDPIDSAAKVLRAHKLIATSDRRSRRPTKEELETLLNHFASADGRQQIPMIDIILFQVFSARRIAETCRLTWADYHPERRVQIVRNMKDPRKKKGNDVETALTDQALAIIERQDRQGELIFPYNSKSIGSGFLRACRLTGIIDLRIHDLRHEATSWLFESGLDIPRVSKVTGHRSWGSLQRYAHMEGVEPFDKYRNWKWLRSNRPARLELV